MPQEPGTVVEQIGSVPIAPIPAKEMVDSPKGPIERPERKLFGPEDFGKLDETEVAKLKEWLSHHAASQEPTPDMFRPPKINIYDLGPSYINGIDALDKETRIEFFKYLASDPEFQKRIIDSGKSPDEWLKPILGPDGEGRSVDDPKYYKEHQIKFDSDAQKKAVFEQLKNCPPGSFVRTIEKSNDGSIKVIFEPPRDAENEVSYVFVTYKEGERPDLDLSHPRGIKFHRMTENYDDNSHTVVYAISPQGRDYFIDRGKPEIPEHENIVNPESESKTIEERLVEIEDQIEVIREKLNRPFWWPEGVPYPPTNFEDWLKYRPPWEPRRREFPYGDFLDKDKPLSLADAAIEIHPKVGDKEGKFVIKDPKTGEIIGEGKDFKAATFDLVKRRGIPSTIVDPKTGADTPNPEFVYAWGAERTGLTPNEYRKLTEQGVQDIDALVRVLGIENVRKVIELDIKLSQRQQEFRGSEAPTGK